MTTRAAMYPELENGAGSPWKPKGTFVILSRHGRRRSLAQPRPPFLSFATGLGARYDTSGVIRSGAKDDGLSIPKRHKPAAGIGSVERRGALLVECALSDRAHSSAG